MPRVFVTLASRFVIDEATESFTVVNEDCDDVLVEEEVESPGTLTIVKHTIGGDATFNFEVSEVEESEGFFTIDLTTVAGAATSTEIELAPGTYEVTEGEVEDWDFTDVQCIYDGESTGVGIDNGEEITVGAGDDVVCTFTNTAEVSDGGSGDDEIVTTTFNTPSNGPIGFFGFSGGSVLGAATTATGAQCDAPLLDSYMRRGMNNNPAHVKLLQEFLNNELGLNLPITGFFGPLTEAAVKTFQLKYAAEILGPWVAFGLPNSQTATGYVYKTTLRWINLIHCNSLDIPMPQLP